MLMPAALFDDHRSYHRFHGLQYAATAFQLLAWAARLEVQETRLALAPLMEPCLPLEPVLAQEQLERVLPAVGVVQQE